MNKLHPIPERPTFLSMIQSHEKINCDVSASGWPALPVAGLGKRLTVTSIYEDRRCVFIFGNGGSAALASHFACDLGKGTVTPNNGHKRFRVIALTDNVRVMTAWES